jgi:REP element-mobilizing transposase RayT
MGKGGYKITNPEGIYFVSFATVGWVDVFTRPEYKDIVVNSLKHCQQQKSLNLYGWCIMSNHVHLLGASASGDFSGLLRDLKKHTASQLLKAIAYNIQESRKEWMLEIFRKAGSDNSRNTVYQFWQHDNQPKECYSYEFTKQKLDYLHNNPVAAGIVDNAEDYTYSSAHNYAGRVGLLKVDLLF